MDELASAVMVVATVVAIWLPCSHGLRIAFLGPYSLAGNIRPLLACLAQMSVAVGVIGLAALCGR